jgi:hypothetical protein
MRQSSFGDLLRNSQVGEGRASSSKGDGGRHDQHQAHMDGIGGAASGRRGHRAAAARVLPPVVPTSPKGR